MAHKPVDKIINVPSIFRSLSGWKRLCVAFVFGGAMALSMPPFNFFPILWLCLPAHILMLQGTKNDKQAFLTGWSFAFGFLVFGLYWIAAAMFVDIATFWWAVPFSVVGLPCFLAVYYGLAATVARRGGLYGVGGAIVFGLLWFLADFARGHLLTGFPWIVLGYAWSGSLPVLQVTSVIGIYGLTLLTAIAASLPAVFADKHKNVRTKAQTALALGIGFFVGVAVWGQMRLETTRIKTVPDVMLRLVQPNIDQKDKWQEGERENHFQELLRLSVLEGENRITHIFWPETASTHYLEESLPHRMMIAAVLPEDTTVLTGVVRREWAGSGQTRYYNSLIAVDDKGDVVATYDKAHLVPFGEYIPFRKIMPIRALAASADFSAGPGPQSVYIKNLRSFSPLICYEAIFSGKVVDPDKRPGFMVNLTNDAWYGRSTGPYQHFAIVRVRAIEEGMPLVRVANTGITGIIDPLGRVNQKLDIFEKGVIDTRLHEAVQTTVFALRGNTIVWALFGIFLFVALLCRKFKR